MNIAKIRKADTANGPGIRLSLFVSGCKLHCPGCFNKEAQDFNYGDPWTPELEEEVLKELSKPFYTGITILGGEPMEHQEELEKFTRRIKHEMPFKTIWMYTGYIYERDLQPGGCNYKGLTTMMLFQNIDVLVDGPFIQEQYGINLKFKGSANQRLIDMKETRKRISPTVVTLDEGV